MIDVTDASFQIDVMDESAKRPVVVDLWAPWCGPCKTLGPIIEKVVAATNGKVLLAKVNVDENPTVSSSFKVQSIPAVYALSGGQIVDGFMGAQPETEIQAFVDRLLANSANSEDSTDSQESIVANLLAKGDEASLLEILQADPGHPEAVVLLANLWIESGRSDEALELLSRIPENAETIKLTELARRGNKESAEAEVRLAQLLPEVKANDSSRQEFLDLLEIMGASNPATAEWRKKLTTQLF